MRVGNGNLQKQHRGKNKIRDPNRPKRPASAYNIMIRHAYPEAKARLQAQGSTSYGDVIKSIKVLDGAENLVNKSATTPAAAEEPAAETIDAQ